MKQGNTWKVKKHLKCSLHEEKISEFEQQYEQSLKCYKNYKCYKADVSPHNMLKYEKINILNWKKVFIFKFNFK